MKNRNFRFVGKFCQCKILNYIKFNAPDTKTYVVTHVKSQLVLCVGAHNTSAALRNSTAL